MRGERIGAEEAPPGGAWRVRFHENRALTIGFGVRNDGGRSVSVRDVGAADDTGLQRVGIRMATRVGPGPLRQIVPFRSFELPAGEERYVQVTLLMARCDAPVVSSVPVSFRVAFYDRRVDVRLRTPVRLVGCRYG